MADIFNGSTVKVYYNDDTGNRSVITDTNTKINELAAFPSFSMTNEVQKIETYDDEYANAIEGQKNVDVVEIVVNYIPNDESHVYLDKKFDSKEEFQLTVLYRIDENAGRVENVMMNGALSSRQINGGKDQVVTMTYNFVPNDVINIEPRDIPSVLHRGDFGVGANGSANYPQYEPDLATGNAFVKISAGSTDNPASVDLMGIELVNGTGKTNSNIMMTTSGDLRLYARNNTVPWTRLFTSGESDTKYMAKSANLSDVASVPNARTNLDVFSKGESDAKFVPKTTTVNGKALTGNIVLSKGDVVLGNVTNDAQLKITSNLSDLNNVAQARTNLGLGSAAVQNIGTSGANIPLLNTANTFSGIQTFTSTISGSISGTADNVRGIVPISNGGTGATDSDSALRNLNSFKFQRAGLNADTNLNNLNGSNAGVYIIATSSFATPANNYPIQTAGSLVVLQNAGNNSNGCTQMFYPYDRNDIYTRTLFYTNTTTSTWTAWNKILLTEQYGIGATTGAPYTLLNKGEVESVEAKTGFANALADDLLMPTLSGQRLGVIVLNNTTSNSYKFQIATSYSTQGKMFFRAMNNGTYWDWKEIYNSSSTIPVANGGTGATDAASARDNLGLKYDTSLLQVGGTAIRVALQLNLDYRKLNNEINNSTKYPTGLTSGLITQKAGGWIAGSDTYVAPITVIGWGDSSAGPHGRWQLTPTTNGLMYRIANGGDSTTFGQPYKVYSSNNTTVDTNGFIKQASPIIKISGDGSFETNEESEGAEVIRENTGTYLITGVLAFNADNVWAIEIPKDINGLQLVWVDYSVLEDGDIRLKVYHRTHPNAPSFAQNIIDGIADGELCDIPQGRVIDLRVQMPDDSIYNIHQDEQNKNVIPENNQDVEE